MNSQEENINNFNVLDQYKTHDIGNLQEISKNDRLPYSVCAINFTGDLNLGIAIRSAHLLGAEKFYTFGRRYYDKRTTVGAHNYIPVTRIWGLSEDQESLDVGRFNQFIDEEKLYPIYCETGGTHLSEFDWFYHMGVSGLSGTKICIVFGNEGTGIPIELYQEQKERVVSIEQRGVLRSYNVAAATAIVMYNLSNQIQQFYG